MKENRHHTAFYMETVILAIAFFLVIQLIVRTFASARSTSLQAEELTHAVILAENSAEAYAGTENDEQLLEILDENGNARKENGEIICLYDEDMHPSADGNVEVVIRSQKESGIDSAEIIVNADGRAVYTLSASRLMGGAK